MNGNKNILNKEQEQMRATVVDLELKARYWKAQFEIRHYTLQAEQLQTPYEEYLDREKAENQKRFEEMQAQLDALRETGGEVETNIPQEVEADA